MHHKTLWQLPYDTLLAIIMAYSDGSIEIIGKYKEHQMCCGKLEPIFGTTAEYIPHAGVDTSLTSTSLMRLIPFWTCSKSIIMWKAAYWIQQLPQSS